MGELYLGVMSGTSQDGVDAAIVEFHDAGSQIHHATTTPYPEELRARIARLLTKPQVSLQELGKLDVAVGRFFAQCILQLVETSSFEVSDIMAIGHSGHTVFHQPEAPDAFTMQIGDPSTIAAETGITTVGGRARLGGGRGGGGSPRWPADNNCGV